jgi:hypothetical protein
MHKELKNRKSERCISCNNSFRWSNRNYKKRVGKKISASQPFKGKRNTAHSLRMLGKKNPAWKGGIKTLTSSIRELPENIYWKKKVLKKDGYRCVECFSKENLHVDHIKQFSIIFKEFLETYDQFSPLEDKETLIRLAMKYKDFFDVYNGQTLCKECHSKKKVIR